MSADILWETSQNPEGVWKVTGFKGSSTASKELDASDVENFGLGFSTWAAKQQLARILEHMR